MISTAHTRASKAETHTYTHTTHPHGTTPLIHARQRPRAHQRNTSHTDARPTTTPYRRCVSSASYCVRPAAKGAKLGTAALRSHQQDPADVARSPHLRQLSPAPVARWVHAVHPTTCLAVCDLWTCRRVPCRLDLGCQGGGGTLICEQKALVASRMNRRLLLPAVAVLSPLRRSVPSATPVTLQHLSRQGLHFTAAGSSLPHSPPLPPFLPAWCSRPCKGLVDGSSSQHHQHPSPPRSRPSAASASKHPPARTPRRVVLAGRPGI